MSKSEEQKAVPRPAPKPWIRKSSEIIQQAQAMMGDE